MPVFDFKHTPDEKKVQECTYTTFRSNETEATAEKPMLVLDNSNRKWNGNNHSNYRVWKKHSFNNNHSEDP